MTNDLLINFPQFLGTVDPVDGLDYIEDAVKGCEHAEREEMLAAIQLRREEVEREAGR